MNSTAARLIKLGLRLQRPLLRRVSKPQHIDPIQILLERAALLPAQTHLQRKSLDGIPYLEIHNRRADKRDNQLLIYVH
ncbi:MAG TPA: hypothetical protein VFM46_17115, partial [Pseudomonadales bacterium]|nr:hypothetical protein [Pseudomonadales bacterium]